MFKIFTKYFQNFSKYSLHLVGYLLETSKITRNVNYNFSKVLAKFSSFSKHFYQIVKYFRSSLRILSKSFRKSSQYVTKNYCAILFTIFSEILQIQKFSKWSKKINQNFLESFSAFLQILLIFLSNFLIFFLNL